MIKKLLEPFDFNFGQLQDIATLVNHLKKNNVSVEDFMEFIKKEKAERVKNEKLYREKIEGVKQLWKKNALKCPECKTVMNLYPVNTGPADQVEKNLQSMWDCPKCHHQIFNRAPTKDIIERTRKNDG